MTVNRNTELIDVKIIRPTFRCKHIYAVKVSKDTSAEQQRRIERDCAKALCPACAAQAGREAARKARAR